MTSGIVTWTDSTTFSLSLGSTVDALTIPAGNAPGNGVSLITSFSFFDPSGTAVASTFTPVFVDGLGTEHTSAGGINFSKNFVFIPTASGGFDPALLDGGGTLRFHTSAAVGGSVSVCVVAAILTNAGVTGTGASNTLSATNTPSTESSGTLHPFSLSPPDEWRDFIVMGNGVSAIPPASSPTASTPNWAVNAQWSNVINVTNGLGWAGIGMLTNPDDPTFAAIDYHFSLGSGGFTQSNALFVTGIIYLVTGSGSSKGYVIGL